MYHLKKKNPKLELIESILEVVLPVWDSVVHSLTEGFVGMCKMRPGSQLVVLTEGRRRSIEDRRLKQFSLEEHLQSRCSRVFVG